MLVKEAIEILEEEPLEDNIIIAHWNKESIEHALDTTLSNDEWSHLCFEGSNSQEWSFIIEGLETILELKRSNK
jgi:hypothetical protein